MAYCSRCGAYIPDGQEKCLACGYDPEEERKQAEQTAAQTQQYSDANEELRKKLEEHERLRREFEESQRLQQKMEQERRQQQEQAKAWAEQEKQRREAEKREAEWKAYNAEHTNNNTSARNNAGVSISGSKLLSVLSYMSGLFVIPMLCRRDDRYAMFHAKQGLRLFLFSLVSDVVSWIPVAGPIVQFARFYLMIKGMINAANGREQPLPYIGKIGM